MRKHKRADNADNKRLNIRHSADYKMADGACERSGAHNKHACADCRFKLVTKHGGEHQEHHHSAAGTDKAANEADRRAACNGANRLLLCRGGKQALFRLRYRLNYEFNAEQKGHKNGKITHCCFGHNTCNIAARHREAKHGNHHYDSVFYIKIFIFSISYCRGGTGKNIAGKSNAHCKIRIHVKKSYQQRGYNRSCAHSGKARSEACAQPRNYANDYFKQN